MLTSSVQRVASRRPHDESGAGIAEELNHASLCTSEHSAIAAAPQGHADRHADDPGSGRRSHSRPMLMHDIDESGWLWFITDRHSRKACELGQNPHATVAFQSKKGDRYVSVQGTAVVVRDDVKLKELWNPTLRSWFPRGRRDPEIVLVAVRVARAEVLAGASHPPFTGHWNGESA